MGGMITVALLSFLLIASGSAAAADPSNVSTGVNNNIVNITNDVNAPITEQPKANFYVKSDSGKVRKENITINGPGPTTINEFPTNDEVQFETDVPGEYEVIFDSTDIGNVTIKEIEYQPQKITLNTTKLKEAKKLNITFNTSVSTSSTYNFRSSEIGIRFKSGATFFFDYSKGTDEINITSQSDWSTIENGISGNNTTIYVGSNVEKIETNSTQLFPEPVLGGGGGSSGNQTLLIGVALAALAAVLLARE